MTQIRHHSCKVSRSDVMHTNTVHILLRWSVFLIAGVFLCCLETVHAQPTIIFKLDDLEAAQSSIDACIPTFEYLTTNGIKAGWGIMRFGNATGDQISVIKKYAAKTDGNGEPLFEFWHHGLEHSKDDPAGTWEFSGTSYAYQKAHLDSASRIAKEQLGIVFRTFGAPYNHTDTTLIRVLGEDPNMKVIMLAQQTPAPSSGIINLTNRVNMESATGIVDFKYFQSNYYAKKSLYTDYMVLQGHPPKWTTDSLRSEFKKIVQFLRSAGCRFVTPIEYYSTMNK